ncbi:MAG TPA: lysylphosphatidylglycerol synthase transmembrane domain-containing protein [Thermoleophilaceae bacterium]|nr:lysylphosphatidylglycerol synthase transmembrane domain-containing protein [Thermoleophilaceae bacterium]
MGGVDRRHVIGTIVVTALLGVGVWLLIGQAANYSRLVDAVRRADPWWLLLSLAGVAVGYLGYALLYQVVARMADGPRPALRLVLRVTIGVLGASTVATAAGRLGGEYWTLRRLGEEPPQAWARVLALNTAEWAVLAGLAWWGALLGLLGAAQSAPLGVTLAWLTVPPVCVLGGMFFTSGKRRRLAEDRGGKVRRTFASALRAVVLLRQVAADRREGARALIGGLLHWGGDLLCVWAALRAFGTDIGFAPLAVAYATGYVSTTLPLPAGGAGGVEAASTYALTLVGVPLGPALLASLVQRICTYWLPLALAIVSARWLRRLGRDLQGVARPAADREPAFAGRSS